MLFLVAGPAVALALALPTLGAGLISDDGAILGWVARHPPLADALGPQYGLDQVRFWRPLTTLSFDLQEASTGVDALPLRAFNALAHALAALAAALLARALVGGSGARWAAALAGLWVATFPHQGGTTGWPAGRVDALCLPFVLLAVLWSLRERGILAAAAAALAIATKEMGWIAAPAALLFPWAAGLGWGTAVRRSAPVWAVTALAIGLRPLLLGDLVGGYPAGTIDPRAVLLGAPVALARGLGISTVLVGLVPLLWVALPRPVPGGIRARGWVAGLVAGVGATLLLAHLVAQGAIAPEHLRTLLVPDALIGVGTAVALAWTLRRDPAMALSRVSGAVRGAAVVTIALTLGWRGVAAATDLRTWAEAGDRAQAQVDAARRDAHAMGASKTPAFDPRFARLDTAGRAYVLHWGAAERLRSPFEPAVRPVWPWRPAFGGGAAHREWLGADAGPLHDGGAATREDLIAGELRVTTATGRLVIDPVDFASGAEGPRVALDVDRAALGGLPEDMRVELLLATDQGYASARLAHETLLAMVEAGASVRQLIGAGSGELQLLLVHAVDTGADKALLEVRAYGPDGAPLLRTRALPVDFAPSLRDFLRHD